MLDCSILRSRYSFYDHVTCTYFPSVSEAVDETIRLRSQNPSTDYADGLLLGFNYFDTQVPKVRCKCRTGCSYKCCNNCTHVILTHHHGQQEFSHQFDTVHRHWTHIYDKTKVPSLVVELLTGALIISELPEQYTTTFFCPTCATCMLYTHRQRRTAL